MRTTIMLLLVLAAGTARADRRADTKPALDDFRNYGFFGKPEPFEPRISPTSARWISLATTAAGLASPRTSGTTPATFPKTTAAPKCSSTASAPAYSP